MTAELGPPLQPDGGQLRETARRLAPLVHAANITDNPAATVKLSPLVCAGWMIEAGLEPILQVTTRDRNLLALQSDLLGAWALGVRSILALSGDPLSVGAYAGLTQASFDLDSIGLLRVVANMNAGLLAAGEELTVPTDFLLLAAVNPLVDTVERLEHKLAAGANCLQTNIVYDLERFADWLEVVVAAGITARAPLIVGVAPPRSTRMLEHLHEHIPGVEVDGATFERMRGLDGAQAKAAGVEIAVAVVARLRELPAVAGVHVMAPGWEGEGVPAVVAGAGLSQAQRT